MYRGRHDFATDAEANTMRQSAGSRRLPVTHAGNEAIFPTAKVKGGPRRNPPAVLGHSGCRWKRNSPTVTCQYSRWAQQRIGAPHHCGGGGGWPGPDDGGRHRGSRVHRCRGDVEKGVSWSLFEALFCHPADLHGRADEGCWNDGGSSQVWIASTEASSAAADPIGLEEHRIDILGRRQRLGTDTAGALPEGVRHKTGDHASLSGRPPALYGCQAGGLQG